MTPNPFTGESLKNDSGKDTQRQEVSLASFRFAVAEMDEIPVGLMSPEVLRIKAAYDADTSQPRPKELAMPKEWQYALWMASRLPVAAIIDSGGKSLHGWIKIDGITTLEQWREWVQPQLFRRILDPMGFDPACKNAGRLSRTVGHVRDNGNTQKLLYLAPASKNRTE